ncbi:uncharacterized protein [Diadema antillarum]|uniref:uncharacterized protein n=1 Tax=Diadema antillarum TaxID=105358 RepID=UPI003A87F266
MGLPFHTSRIRLNSLESIWYCNLSVVITIFLVVDGNRRYHYYASLPWPEGERPTPELRLYQCLIVWAVLLIIGFIPTQYLKVGNHANDQSKLGAKGKRRKEGKTRTDASDEHLDGLESMTRQMKLVVQNLQASRRHLGPIGATIHITSAFCLLLPVMFLQARAIQYGLLPKELIWTSEVGEIYLDQIPSRDGISHTPTDGHPSLSDYQSSAPTPPLEYTTIPVEVPGESFSTVVITINYLNYVVPLFLYAIRYADVFWACHKGFALLVSCQLMMNAVQYALGFIGMSLLYKLHWYGWEKFDIGRPPVFSSAPSLIAAFLLNNITVFVAAAILYLYGYGRLKRSQRKNNTTDDSVYLESMFVFKCNGFLPQIAALCALIVFICCKTPFMIEYLAIYRFSGDGRMLCCVVFDTLFIIFWFFLWIFLSVNRHWNFSHANIAGFDQDQGKSDPEKYSQGYIANNMDAEGSLENTSFEGDSCKKVHSGSFVREETLNTGRKRSIKRSRESLSDEKKEEAECVRDEVDEGLHHSGSVGSHESLALEVVDANVNIVSNPL